MFARFFIRRPRRLRHLRRLAATAATAPATLTRLPHRTAIPASTTTWPCLPHPAPARPDPEELRVRAWLHHQQYGHTPTATHGD
ncbi:hypothetical protein [Streptomyces clavuligerus]|uniref:Uncharacterized protein n=1 Tax=Streptomyces clavuligerus TaxID=1901 RepID=B5GUN6_STRCL|nr:hypothetical protein [Streptomyces clavuligerus]EDY50032.1 hypothetical protein SSCG_03286 [Streptomyces clavuligerus]EFG03740.1 Hypothetical protein SCLAV_p0249 [Streptomyces clavuligerus]MBY6307720.1 hypothetical protein [Streptomyces clavuligerus]QCS09730.1 hypothetical protein CRV15_29355 [Streptomyces clavuligerus]QPJ98224.1 hypothetical protein GE265_35035 [Streptomyces clavuligerus]